MKPIPTKNMAAALTAAIVKTKTKIASKVVRLKVSISVLMLSPIPASKRIIMKVIVVKIRPISPK
jgi:hypothetical protein